MSNIIKSSNIVGTYLLPDQEIVPKKIEKAKCTKLSEKFEEKEELVEREAEKEELEIIDAARSEAEEIINQARQKVSEMLEKAEQEAAANLEQYKKEGYQVGHREGYEQGQLEGHQAGLSKTTDTLATLENVVIETTNQLGNRVEQLSADLIELALKIAERMVNSHLPVEPTLINNIVKEMVQEINNINQVDIYIHPDLLEYIDEQDFKDNLARQKVHIYGDGKLEFGDCIVETELGGRDGTLSNKLRLLERELLKGAGFDEGA